MKNIFTSEVSGFRIKMSLHSVCECKVVAIDVV